MSDRLVFDNSASSAAGSGIEVSSILVYALTFIAIALSVASRFAPDLLAALTNAAPAPV